MKKALFFLFFIWVFTVPALADYSVDSISVTADVSDRGGAAMTTAVQLTFDAPAEQVTIPLPEGDVTGVSVSGFRFSVRRSDEGVDVVVKNRYGFAGVQTLVIGYTVPYSGGGGGEYSLGFLSSRWGRDIGGCSFQVLMPKPLEEAPKILSGYYGALTAGQTGLLTSDTSFSGAVGARMAFDSLSMSITLPEGYFTVRRRSLPVISVTYLTVLMGAVLILTMIYWRRRLRSDRSAAAARMLLPEGVQPCQLPMVLDGSSCDFAALVLDWANLGYVALARNAGGTAYLIRRMAMGSERSAAEQRLFARIFGQKSQVALAPGRFSAAAVRYRAAARRSLYRSMIDRSGGNPVLVQTPCRLLLAVGIGSVAYGLMPEGAGAVAVALLAGTAGLVYSLYFHSALGRLFSLGRWSRSLLICLAVMAGLLPLSLLGGALPELLVGLIALWFSAAATASGPRRSPYGVDAMAQTRGLRRFLRRVSWQRLQKLQRKNSRFFQSQLPQATALRADRAFARRFERLTIPHPEWLAEEPEPTRSAAGLQKQLAPIVKQLREAFR